MEGDGNFFLQDVGKFVSIGSMRNTRPISWIKAAWRDVEFPEDGQSDMLDALTIKRLKEALT